MRQKAPMSPQGAAQQYGPTRAWPERRPLADDAWRGGPMKVLRVRSRQFRAPIRYNCNRRVVSTDFASQVTSSDRFKRTAPRPRRQAEPQLPRRGRAWTGRKLKHTRCAPASREPRPAHCAPPPCVSALTLRPTRANSYHAMPCHAMHLRSACAPSHLSPRRFARCFAAARRGWIMGAVIWGPKGT